MAAVETKWFLSTTPRIPAARAWRTTSKLSSDRATESGAEWQWKSIAPTRLISEAGGGMGVGGGAAELAPVAGCAALT